MAEGQWLCVGGWIGFPREVGLPPEQRGWGGEHIYKDPCGDRWGHEADQAASPK